MLRKILIGIGIVIALLPYSGFPQSIDTIISTVAGLTIIVLLSLSHRSGKLPHLAVRGEGGEPNENSQSRPLRIERPEVKSPSYVRIEGETITGIKQITAPPKLSASVEETATLRRRRRKTEGNAPFSLGNP